MGSGTTGMVAKQMGRHFIGIELNPEYVGLANARIGKVRSVAHEELKPRDKMVTRMTRDGVVEDNLTEGTSERVSKRLEDAQLIAPHDAEPGDIAEEVRRRRQLRPDELENAEGQTKAEMQSTDTVPGISRVSFLSAKMQRHTLRIPRHITLHGLTMARLFADNAFTGKVSRPRAEGRLTAMLFWKERLKLPQKCRTSVKRLCLPAGSSVWSANPRRRMSVWMPPVRSCLPKC